ncbi:MAG: pentapeptide repeat-containing protein [Spirochaetota bacterium]|nr:pentapeptide repeat-containing protein [Spirochaetota bacterium]
MSENIIIINVDDNTNYNKLLFEHHSNEVSESNIIINKKVEFRFSISMQGTKSPEVSLSNIHFKETVDFLANVESFETENRKKNIFLNNIKCDKNITIQNLNLNVIHIDDTQINQLIVKRSYLNNFYCKSTKDIKNIKIKNITFDSVTFHKEVFFYGIELNTINFTNSTFKNKADFKNSTLTNCNFSFTRFMGKADFKRVKFHGENKFNYTQFNERGAFYGAYFDSNPTFHNLILGKDSHIYFGEINKCIKDSNDQVIDKYIKNLEKDLKISIEFNEQKEEFIKQKEEFIKQKEEFIKQEEEFDEQYKDLIKKHKDSIKQEEDLITRYRSFKRQREDFIKQIVIEKIVIEKISLTNTIINGRLDFSNDNITTLDMKGCVIAGTLSRVLFAPKCANWETATLLKNEELKQNNIIRALEYKAEEKDLYENELWIQLNKKSSIKLITEWLSLWIGKVSNNHGQNWGQGVFFTAIVWFVCFSMFYISFPYYDINNHFFTGVYWKSIGGLFTSGQFFSNMVEYFNPTNYKLLTTYITSSNPEWWVKIFGAFWFLLGKALVPYGIFEVVQAFRKYNKID